MSSIEDVRYWEVSLCFLILIFRNMTYKIFFVAIVWNTSSLIPVPNFMIIGAITEVWWGSLMPPPPPSWLTVFKSPCQIGLTLKNLRGGSQNDPRHVFFRITRERKKIFNEILAYARIWHKTIAHLSKFEKCPYVEGRAAKLRQNFAWNWRLQFFSK